MSSMTLSMICLITIKLFFYKTSYDHPWLFKRNKEDIQDLAKLSRLLNFDEFTPFVKFDLKPLGNEIYN